MNQKTIAIAAVLTATLASLLSTSIASPITAVAEKSNDYEDHDEDGKDYDRDHKDGDGKDSKKFYPGDTSETNTEQTLKQKNVGSGASANLNCGTNNFDATASVTTCGSIDAAALQHLTGLPTG
jgi:hypothetical protein